ncbi:MAG: S8 family serine peptidase [Calditrichaeota bacterium]|nr:S8 family serine peptidase [Calditrichota bacterium]
MAKKIALISIFGLVWRLFLSDSFARENSNQSGSWDFLNTTAIGAKQFIEKNPEADGRGVVIFILDSGVDPGVPGLQKTSVGEVKIIDVRDFTGQGDVALYAGEPGQSDGEKYIEHPDGFRLFNYQKLKFQPENGEYWIGYLDEHRFRNSKVGDVNNNGKTDDQFGVLAFETAEADSFVWLVYVDTDGDRQLDDEKPLRDYCKNYEIFHFRGGDSRYDARPLNFAINFDSYGMKVSFYFDDEGHGTHVAGIAAGYQIFGQENFNGIAPGAQIISLKIGNGDLPGGSTTTSSVARAIEFIEDYLQSHSGPVVVNLSYGIGAIQPGKSDISHLFHRLILDHDNVFVCVSNGNEGPGIATTGAPAAEALVFSVGAFLPRKTANDVLGTHLKQDQLFYFSSRGGRVNKPDAIAPGFASSTVPAFAREDLSRGTSMAAPQISGAAALLISAVRKIDSKNRFTSLMLKQALKQSATPLPQFSAVDQGGGIVNVPLAFEILKKRIAARKMSDPVSYEVVADSPVNSETTHDGAYWRVGGYFPADGEKTVFRVYPIFPDSVAADQRAQFYRAFTLRSQVAWLKPEKKFVYLRGEDGVEIAVRYDGRQLSDPGLYAGKIFAVRKDIAGPRLREFELLNTVIVPYHFTNENSYRRQFEERRLSPGDWKRYFIQTPPGATEANISLKATGNRFCRINLFCHSPAGGSYREIYGITSKDSRAREIHISGKDLQPGIWEVVVQADALNEKRAAFQLSVSFAGFTVSPDVIADYHYSLGKEPNGTLDVCNEFSVPFYGFAVGELPGYQRKKQLIVQNVDHFDYSFQVKENARKVRFVVEIAPEAFLKMSDIALIVTDSRRQKIADEALSFPKGEIEIFPKAGEFYNLRVQAAFVHGNSIGQWKFKLTEQYELTEKINVKIYADENRLFWLYPSIKRKLDFVFDKSPRVAPDGFDMFGDIKFYARDKVRQVFSVPVSLKNY